MTGPLNYYRAAGWGLPRRWRRRAPVGAPAGDGAPGGGQGGAHGGAQAASDVTGGEDSGEDSGAEAEARTALDNVDLEADENVEHSRAK